MANLTRTDKLCKSYGSSVYNYVYSYRETLPVVSFRVSRMKTINFEASSYSLTRLCQCAGWPGSLFLEKPFSTSRFNVLDFQEFSTVKHFTFYLTELSVDIL